jgi:hypothetical protein
MHELTGVAMGKLLSVLCLIVLTAPLLETTAASAQTLNVGLRIVAANGAGAAASVQQSGNKRIGHIRIREYASAGYSALLKARKQASSPELE